MIPSSYLYFYPTFWNISNANSLIFLTHRYDTRGQSHLEARHWSDEDVLGGRAFFRGDQGRCMASIY